MAAKEVEMVERECVAKEESLVDLEEAEVAQVETEGMVGDWVVAVD